MNRSIYFLRISLALMLFMLIFTPAHGQIFLQADTKKLDVSTDIHIWIDDTPEAKTIEEVAFIPAEQWIPLQGPMSLGFTNSVVWLRLAIETTDDTDWYKWILELNQPLLQKARMYWVDANGQWQTVAGTPLESIGALGFHDRRPVFDLPLHPGQTQPVWLRVQTQTSMSSAFYIWRHDAFASHRAQESFVWGLVFGTYFFVIIFYALYSVWNRNPLHAKYTVYMLGNLAAAWLTGNWFAVVGFSISAPTTVLFLGLTICWINFLGTLFNLQLLNLKTRRPQLSRALLWITAAIGILGSAGVLLGQYSAVIPWVQSSVIALIVVNIYLGVSELVKRNPNASLFLWGFSVFYVGIVVRYLRNMGWLEPNFWTEHSYQIGSFIHMIIMSVGIFTSYNRLQRERNEAVALADAEHKQREQQAEFLGLVSHELRTPLTIVSTAADNMEQQSVLDELGKQRLGKIQRATERMRNIIDGYLNAERLTGTKPRNGSESLDLLVICRQCIKSSQEKREHPVRLHLEGVGDFKMTGDALQIQVAIDNLLSNAQSHTTLDAAIEMYLRCSHESLTIEVVNKGDPINPRDLPYLFERFYRGSNAKNRPGSGLGLYLVQGVAAMHHGYVLAENLPSGHCRFTLVLGRA